MNMQLNLYVPYAFQQDDFQSGIVYDYFTYAAFKDFSEQSEIIAFDHVAKVDRSVLDHNEHTCLEIIIMHEANSFQNEVIKYKIP